MVSDMSPIVPLGYGLAFYFNAFMYLVGAIMIR